jgi:hypothetical protein
MIKWHSLLGAAALMIASFGQASASTVMEEISVFYNVNPSIPSLDIANLSFSTGGSGNLFSGLGPFTTGVGQTVFGSGTLFTQTFSLDTSLTYTFSVGGTFSGSVFVTPTGGTQTFGVFNGASFATLSNVGANISPVPLPASFPLFALALISLVAFGYHSRRKGARLVAPIFDGVSA